ncbi:type IV pilin protein [Candidatus Poribacteria bacterium]
MIIRLRDDSGFSLMELMIVLTVMVILTAVTIAKFTNLALASKMSEATGNLAIIRTAQFSFKAANDMFVECGPSPPDPAGSDGRAYFWAETLNSSGEKGFEMMGFQPDGIVRYQYEVATATGRKFVATAQADLDNDGASCVFTLDNQAARYSKPVRAPAWEF